MSDFLRVIDSDGENFFERDWIASSGDSPYELSIEIKDECLIIHEEFDPTNENCFRMVVTDGEDKSGSLDFLVASGFIDRGCDNNISTAFLKSEFIDDSCDIINLLYHPRWHRCVLPTDNHPVNIAYRLARFIRLYSHRTTMRHGRGVLVMDKCTGDSSSAPIEFPGFDKEFPNKVRLLHGGDSKFDYIMETAVEYKVDPVEFSQHCETLESKNAYLEAHEGTYKPEIQTPRSFKGFGRDSKKDNQKHLIFQYYQRLRVLKNLGVSEEEFSIFAEEMENVLAGKPELVTAKDIRKNIRESEKQIKQQRSLMSNHIQHVVDDPKTTEGFAYSVNNHLRGVPDLLCFYPAQNTKQFVLKDISIELDKGTMAPLVEGEVRVLKGWLGQNSDMDIRMRLLNPDERKIAADYATAVDLSNPVILVEIPDVDGNFEEDSQAPEELMRLQPKELRVMQPTAA